MAVHGLIIGAFVAVAIVMSMLMVHVQWTSERAVPARSASGKAARVPLAEGCTHVYVDVGTNLGVQLRKLFQPEHYPGAKVLPIFDAMFGKERARGGKLCAFGFEPNPTYVDRLSRIESAYRANGWRIQIFTTTAAGLRDGEKVKIQYTGNKFFDLSASAVESTTFKQLEAAKGADAVHTAQVPTVDLARFLNEEVHARSQASAPEAAVVMKIDIEGAEIDVLPDLLVRGALCKVDVLFAEFHQKRFRGDKAHFWDYDAMQKHLLLHWPGDVHNLTRGAANPAPRCPLKVSSLDDESYRYDDGRSFLLADRAPGTKRDANFANRRTPPLPRGFTFEASSSSASGSSAPLQ